MIIDCHGHYTTAPQALWDWRQRQVASLSDPTITLGASAISDEEIRASLLDAQLRLQRERGTDLTMLSPRASSMEHHIGDAQTSKHWTEVSNDLIHRVCSLYPDNFVGVCQLPQSPGLAPSASIEELERCVVELGFVGCNLTPDTSGGHWNDPAITDRSWYPFYEKLVELDVPAMIHVSGSCTPAVHTTGAYYLNADTTVFVQLMLSDLFRDFPGLRLIIPHGGGAVPYHWGRFRGLTQDVGRPPLEELLAENLFFDTCVYHLAGMECLFKVVPVENILFASEMVGAVRGIDPRTGQYYDDTKRYLDALTGLGAHEREQVFEGNARRVFRRLGAPR